MFPAVCILVAFITTRFNQKQTKNLAPSISSGLIVSNENKIFSELPEPNIESTSGKILAASLQKTRSSPREAKNWIETGDAFAQIQRETEDVRYFDAAEKAYLEALRLTPNNVNALAGMSWVTGGRHQFEQSIEWGKQALTANPECIEAFGIIGDAALELGDYEMAFDHYQKMMDLRPDLSSWSRGAHLLWLTGEPHKAMTLMGKAIAAGAPFAENTAWCQIRMATMLFHQGAISPAEDAIRPLLESGSKNSHLLLLAARIASAKSDFSLAEKHYQRMLESGPSPHAYAGIGDLLTARGKITDAEIYYQKAGDVHANHTVGEVHDHGVMAKFLADNDRDLLEALHMVEEHKLTKNVYEADTLAWVYYKNNMLPQAIKAMKKALRHNTPDPEMHYHAGMIASAYGDLRSAKNHLERALAMNPNFSVIQAPRAQKELERLAQRRTLTQAEPENN